MRPKLKRAVKLSFWAFVFWITAFSLVSKIGWKKHGPNQPLSWEELFSRLPLVITLALICALVVGLGSLLEKMPPQQDVICPRCGIDQPEFEKDLLSEKRTCIACKETTPKVEWKFLNAKSE
jgi:hypothetical protein